MKREQFKILLNEAIKHKAFSYLLERKRGRISDNAKGRCIIYEDFEMSEYLRPHEEYISIEEQKLIFR